jgi:hypothetical protein
MKFLTARYNFVHAVVYTAAFQLLTPLGGLLAKLDFVHAVA